MSSDWVLRARRTVWVRARGSALAADAASPALAPGSGAVGLDIRQTCAAARGKGEWESGYGRQTSVPALRRPVPVLQQGVPVQLAAQPRGAGCIPAAAQDRALRPCRRAALRRGAGG